MKTFAAGLSAVIIIFLSASICDSACQRVEQLFVIERSKNANTVHYDVCIDESDGLSETEPVLAYWILESGTREELSGIEREYAYGVIVRERKARDRLIIGLVSMKAKAISVEKIGDHYRAVTLIDGRESVLERIYLKSREQIFGPKVLYIDLFGRTTTDDRTVYERIDKP